MLAQVIDSLKFAREGGVLHGTIPLAEMARLREHLRSCAGSVGYRLTGRMGLDGKPVIELEVTGLIELTCQRCLERLVQIVEVSEQFLLAEDEKDLGDVAEEDAGVTRIPADPKMDVASFVEDELILEIPIAPRHPPGTCVAGRFQEAAPAQTSNPFIALAALKKQDVNGLI